MASNDSPIGTRTHLHEIDVFRVPSSGGQVELVESCSAAESERVGDRGILKESYEGSANDEVLLDLYVLNPRSRRAPLSEPPSSTRRSRFELSRIDPGDAGLESFISSATSR